MTFKTTQNISSYTHAVNVYRLYRISFFDDIETVEEVKMYDQYEVTLSEIIKDISKYLESDYPELTIEDIAIGQFRSKINLRKSRSDLQSQIVHSDTEEVVFVIDVLFDECDSFFVTHESIKV